MTLLVSALLYSGLISSLLLFSSSFLVLVNLTVTLPSSSPVPSLSSHHPQTIKAFQGVLQYPKLFANDMCHISYCICIYSSTAARPTRPRILNSHVYTCPYHDSVLRLSFHRLSIRSPVAPSTAALSLCVALTTLSFSSSAHSAMKVEVSETYPADHRQVSTKVHIS